MVVVKLSVGLCQAQQTWTEEGLELDGEGAPHTIWGSWCVFPSPSSHIYRWGEQGCPRARPKEGRRPPWAPALGTPFLPRGCRRWQEGGRRLSTLGDLLSFV